MAAPLSIPPISWDQISTFRQTHFSSSAQSSFFSHFLPPTGSQTPAKHADTATEDEYHGLDDMEYEYYVEELDDGVNVPDEEEEEEDLGFYPDGQKRTLTDAQIAIFRHSEIQDMLKAKRKELELELAQKEAEEEAEFAAAEAKTSKNITEDYSPHDPRSRPVDTGGALPWDDEDVGAWESNQQDGPRDKGKGRAPAGVVKKPVVKPTFDAPSGRQFFWPVIDK